MSPPLAEDLVRQAPLAVLELVGRAVRDDLDEVLAVEEPLHRLVAAALEDGAVPVGQGAVTFQARHLLGGTQRRQVQASDEGVGPDEVDVERVVLRVFDKAVAVAVVGHHVIHRFADLRPRLVEEPHVRRHQVLAVHLQDRPALAVGGVGPVAPKPHQAGLLVEAALGRQVLHQPRRTREFRKQPRARVLVVPNVRARARAAADAFPCVEPPVLPPLARLGGQRRDGHRQARRKPVWQRRVEVRVAPQVRLCAQPLEVCRRVRRHVERVLEPVRVHTTDARPVREIPRDEERGVLLLARRQVKGRRQVPRPGRPERVRSVVARFDDAARPLAHGAAPGLGVEDRERHVAVGGMLARQPRVPAGRDVREADVVDVDVPPRAGVLVHDDEARRLADEFADVPGAGFEPLVAAPRDGADHLAAHLQVHARGALVVAAADQEGDVRFGDRERAGRERTLRPVVGAERVDETLAVPSGHGLLDAELAGGGRRPERLARRGPAVVGAFLEILEDGDARRFGRFLRRHFHEVHHDGRQTALADDAVPALEAHRWRQFQAHAVLEPAGQRHVAGLR